jgi:AmmeMemoRadiSam system protein B
MRQYSTYSDDSKFYLRAIRAAQAREKLQALGIGSCLSEVRWGVVSHHLLIADKIAEFFFCLSKQAHPRTIVIVGPNHRSRGRAMVAISALPWKTPFGLISPDENLIKAMVNRGIASIDEDAFYNEHSIGALVPFVRYFFPDTHIAPIIMRPDADTTTAARLASFLSGAFGEGVLPIASLDFSHHKSSREAMREDSVTVRVLHQFDATAYQKTFVDSRVTLFTLLASSRTSGAREIDILLHTNSGILTGRPDEGCTSYINFFLRGSFPQKSQLGRTSSALLPSRSP